MRFPWIRSAAEHLMTSFLALGVRGKIKCNDQSSKASSFWVLMDQSDSISKKDVMALAKLPAEEVPVKISEYRKAQAEREERRRQAREEKHKQTADEPRKLREEERTVREKTVGIDFEYLKGNEAEGHEPQINYDSIIGIIRGAAERMQGTCDNYFADYPELLEQKRPQICDALLDLKHYIDNIFEGGN